MQLYKGKTISKRFIWQLGLSLIKHFISTAVMNRPHKQQHRGSILSGSRNISVVVRQGELWVLGFFWGGCLWILYANAMAVYSQRAVKCPATLSAWKSKSAKKNAAVTWIAKHKTLLVKEGEELGLTPALRSSGNQILAQSGSLTPLMCLSRACLKPTDLHLHLWQNRYWEGRKIKTLPVHLSEPVTSVLLISGRGSYSVRPEGRGKKEMYLQFIHNVFSLSKVKFQGIFWRKILKFSYQQFSQHLALALPREQTCSWKSCYQTQRLGQLAFAQAFIIPWALPPCWLSWHVHCLMSLPSALSVCPSLQSCTRGKQISTEDVDGRVAGIIRPNPINTPGPLVQLLLQILLTAHFGSKSFSILNAVCLPKILWDIP